MLIAKKVSLNRIISGTWKLLVFDLIICTITFLVVTGIPSPYFDIPVLIPTVLGTALAFFIGFNNNQAYDRWWEARKIWGALVNDSRTWARQLISFRKLQSGANPDASSYERTMIYRHLGFLYALKQGLRKSPDKEYTRYLSPDDRSRVQSETNTANAILTLQARDLSRIYSGGLIDGFEFQELNKMLVGFCDEMGRSERIANTVFPTSYHFYTRIFIWLFIILITMVSTQSIEIWAIPAGTLVGYVFLTTHNIGQTLLNPFEPLPTCVPLDQITRTIEINLLETLREKEIPSPVQPIRGEFVM